MEQTDVKTFVMTSINFTLYIKCIAYVIPFEYDLNCKANVLKASEILSFVLLRIIECYIQYDDGQFLYCFVYQCCQIGLFSGKFDSLQTSRL